MVFYLVLGVILLGFIELGARIFGDLLLNLIDCSDHILRNNGPL